MGSARERASNVVIIVGGTCGMVALLARAAGKICNVRVLDRSAEGVEGP